MSCSLKMEGICFDRDEQTLLKDINLRVGHKEKVAIIGANGCGKSTLLRIIGGLIVAKSGALELFHQKVTTKKEYAPLREKVGFLLQDSDDQFISPTVLEDVAFGLLCRGETQKVAVHKSEEILDTLGISHLKNRVVMKLSGGEKKLVALAGILICEPLLMLLDEPTNGLDSRMEEIITEKLKEIDKSMIIVSHDHDFVKKVVEKIYILEDGVLKLCD